MEFVPLEPGKVRLYACGPTVYHYAHIGNLRTYVFEDILRRTLEYFSFDVKHVINITDVGHLTSDADTGMDKMVVGARREGKTVSEIAHFYENAFINDLAALNVQLPHILPRATDHIPQMIQLVDCLLRKGYAYRAGGNVYFSVESFPRYGALAHLRLDQQDAGARVEIDPNKRNPFDFVLWFTESKFSEQTMKWSSPWGEGSPGWHVECSAMATHYLGERIDIHCGGVDHIAVHHSNEIAQSEACLGHKWVNYWLHGEFLIDAENKMSKSANAFLTLSDLQRRGFSALDFRYMCLGTHYRKQLNFSFEALQAARNAVNTLRNLYVEWLDLPGDDLQSSKEAYRKEFEESVARDLNVPQALAAVWKMVRDSSLGPRAKCTLLLDFDRILGLGVIGWQREGLAEDLAILIRLREHARATGDFSEADGLRERLRAAGVGVQDTAHGTKWYRLH